MFWHFFIKKFLSRSNKPWLHWKNSEHAYTPDSYHLSNFCGNFEIFKNDMTTINLFLGLDVFAENLRELLLTLPCRNSVVMGLDPGFKHGCKMAVIDVNGQVLQTGVVYPRVQDLSVQDETFLINTIGKSNI